MRLKIIPVLAVLLVSLFLGSLVLAERGEGRDGLFALQEIDAQTVMKWENLSEAEKMRYKQEWEIRYHEKISDVKSTDTSKDSADATFKILSATRLPELAQAGIEQRLRTEFRLKDDRVEIREKIRIRAAERLEEKWVIHELRDSDTCAWMEERVRLAMNVAQDQEQTVLAARLESLLGRLEACTDAPSNEVDADAENAIWDLRQAHLIEVSGRILTYAESVSTKLDSFLARLQLLGEQSEDNQLSVKIQFLTAKLTRLNNKLDAHIADLQEKRDTFIANPTPENAGKLRASFLSTRAWAKVSVHATQRVVFIWNHWKQVGDEDELIVEAEATIPDDTEAEVEVEAEVQDEILVNDAAVLTDVEVAVNAGVIEPGSPGNDSTGEPGETIVAGGDQ
ncbi:MAG: hypothetical protein Q8P05_02540 [Candidatus Diapherotrites archaeon]|nr:hypothetical protein [Candidatus Diapherotrites archaeon]MDZ4256893.1 hypothetical protein [archaeon]